MRRRIGGNETRLGGNSAPPILPNEPGPDPAFNAMAFQCHVAVALVWPSLEGCDFRVDEHSLVLGVEPSYMGDPLKLIVIHKNKAHSAFVTGHGFGYWGAGVRKKTKLYSTYKKQSKFTRFVDEWHPKLFPPVS